MKKATTIIFAAVLLAGCAATHTPVYEPKNSAGDYSNYYEKYYGEEPAEVIAEKVAAEEIRPEVPQQFPPPGVLLQITKEIATPAEIVSQLEETCSWEGNYCVITARRDAEEPPDPESKSFLGGVLEVLGKMFSGGLGGFGGFGGCCSFGNLNFGNLNFGGFMR